MSTIREHVKALHPRIHPIPRANADVARQHARHHHRYHNSHYHEWDNAGVSGWPEHRSAPAVRLADG